MAGSQNMKVMHTRNDMQSEWHKLLILHLQNNEMYIPFVHERISHLVAIPIEEVQRTYSFVHQKWIEYSSSLLWSTQTYAGSTIAVLSKNKTESQLNVRGHSAKCPGMEALVLLYE